MKTGSFMLTGIGVMLLNAALALGSLCGFVYFILWALKHFNII